MNELDLAPGQQVESVGMRNRRLFREHREVFEDMRIGRGLVDPREVSRLTTVDTGGESLVQQHLRDEQDINVIMRRFMVTGTLPQAVDIGMFGDFTEIEDFESAVERVDRAYDVFMKLPAEVREKFDNDPGKLLRMAAESGHEAVQAVVFPPVVDEPPSGGES